MTSKNENACGPEFDMRIAALHSAGLAVFP